MRRVLMAIKELEPDFRAFEKSHRLISTKTDKVDVDVTNMVTGILTSGSAR